MTTFPAIPPQPATLDEIAERFRISVAAVRRLIATGALRAIYPNGRSPRIPWQSVLDYENARLELTEAPASDLSPTAPTSISSGPKKADRAGSQRERMTRNWRKDA